MRISDWSSDVCSFRSPGFGRLHDGLVDSAEIAGGPQKNFSQPLNQRRRRIVGDQVARELGGDVAGGGGMARKILQHRQRLLLPAFGVALAEASSTARLVRLRLEGEAAAQGRSEEHTSEIQSLMRTSYAVFCLNK